MGRIIVHAVLILSWAAPLHAQDAAERLPVEQTWWIGESGVQPAGILAVGPGTPHTLLPPSHRSYTSRPQNARARLDCPQQARGFFTGAAIGLFVGGSVGYALADRLPNPGVGDVPPEAVYVPLFAIPAGLFGGLIGAYTGRCSPR